MTARNQEGWGRVKETNNTDLGGERMQEKERERERGRKEGVRTNHWRGGGKRRQRAA